MSLSIAYLCVSPLREGQAGYTHVNQIIKGLRSLNRNVELYAVPAEASQKPLIIRISQMLLTQIRLIWSLSSYDVLYIRAHFVTLPTILFAKITKIPVVLEINGPYQDLFLAWPFTRYFSFFFIMLMKYMMRLSDSIIVVTPQLKNWVIKEIGNRDIYVIPNGADVEHFFPDAQNDFHIDKDYAIFFGALAVWQGIEDILKATKEDQWPDNLLLVIAGEGMKEDEVIRYEKDNENIKYLGVVPYQMIPGLIAESVASFACMNNVDQRSDTGLSPIKLFESLACGVPVIVTELPGLSNFVKENDCGVIVPLNSPKSIADAVNKLYGDKEFRNRLAENGLNIVTKEHSWYQRAVDTDQIILNTIKQ